MASRVPYASHLLPPSATAPARALATMLERIQTIPTPIEATKRPFDTPPPFLPFIAWDYSVDVWRARWPEATQRAVAASSIRLHRKKGTAHTIREYVRYAGGAVLDITTPPQRVFSGPSPSREQREAWLAGLPQVRTWRIQESAVFGHRKAFHGGYAHALHIERSYPVSSTALSRLKRRARWVVDGVETTTAVSDFGTYFRLHVAGTAGQRVFSRRPIRPGRYFVPSAAWRRLVTIAPLSRGPWRFPIGPTMQAIASEPERIVVAGSRGRGVFSMRCFGASFFVPTTAPLRIYQRFAVVDSEGSRRGPAVQIMGTGCYGWPRHTAEIRVSVPGTRNPRAAGAGIVTPRTQFWLPHDAEPLKGVSRAIQSAKRLSDRILLDVGPKPRFVAGGRPVIANTETIIVGRP